MYRLKTIDLIPLEGKWKMRRANSKAVLSKLLVKFFFLDVDGTLNIYKKMTNVTDSYICTCVTNFSMVIVFCPTFFSFNTIYNYSLRRHIYIVCVLPNVFQFSITYNYSLRTHINIHKAMRVFNMYK